MEIDQILKLAEYTLPQIKFPKTNSPIQIFPLPPLPQCKPLEEELLKKMGILKEEQKNKNQSFGSLFFPCTASCLAVSKDTLEEINTGNDVLEQNRKHLKDEKKREEFRSCWKNVKKRTIKREKMSFEKAYETFGHLTQEQWKQNLQNIFS